MLQLTKAIHVSRLVHPFGFSVVGELKRRVELAERLCKTGMLMNFVFCLK